jgi:hypothetical protein
MVTDASKWTATEWLQYFSDDLPKINNWRAAHAHPLNTFQMNLRRSATRVDSEALIDLARSAFDYSDFSGQESNL